MVGLEANEDGKFLPRRFFFYAFYDKAVNRDESQEEEDLLSNSRLSDKNFPNFSHTIE